MTVIVALSKAFVALAEAEEHLGTAVKSLAEHRGYDEPRPDEVQAVLNKVFAARREAQYLVGPRDE